MMISGVNIIYRILAKRCEEENEIWQRDIVIVLYLLCDVTILGEDVVNIEAMGKDNNSSEGFMMGLCTMSYKNKS